MAAEVVTVSTGVMKPLIGKLATLMGDEYKKLKGVRKEASFLRDELSAMNAVLEKLELMEKLEPDTKNWRDHVREMAYDMENCIDDFMHNLGGANANASFFNKTARRLKTLRARHRIASQIEDLKALAVDANERRMRYKIDDCINSSSVFVPVDPRMSAIYKEAAGLVGIDGPREELVSWLTDTEKELKVVSIVGFGGLGKTTLAKQVYDEITGQFTYKAFISVSQRPDMTSLLSDLELKLGVRESSNDAEVSSLIGRERMVQTIINRLREHLKCKRYLIVVDDLWDQPTWNIINCAFVKDGNGSRVIVTTRVDDVALWACHNHHESIYRMKPLKEQDARRLFFNRVFGYEDGCPLQLKEISAEILKKCGGLPLAIITIASLLASRQARSRTEWESIRNSLGSKFAAKPTLEEMMSILNLSYMHLPLHLRACFLYLGMYPEDKEIKRDDLIRQWIAEGLVSHLHGSDLDAAAKSYFNELINRSLILTGKSKYGEVVSCRVHDMMLDLILSKCAENNFISVAHNSESLARLHYCEYKVRRLSVKLSARGNTSGTIGTSLSQIRSYAQFGESAYTPALSQFKYLRVLAFESDSFGPPELDLTTLGQLVELRYLKVLLGASSIKLPTRISGLVHLETLIISAVEPMHLPFDLVQLPCLSYLSVREWIELPKQIGSMKSLRTLSGFSLLLSSLEDIKGLGELMNLTNLCLFWNHEIDLTCVDAFMSSITKLRNLKCLCLTYRRSCLSWVDAEDRLNSLSDPPPSIEVLKLKGWIISRVPKWIGDLHCLHSLELHVREMSIDGVHVLGELPSLARMSLNLEHIPEGRVVMVNTGLFPVLDYLKIFSYRDDVATCLVFEAGAMPKLRKFVLSLFIKEGGAGATPVGMEHLLGLEQIHVDLFSINDDVWDSIHSAFRNASQEHPNHPSLTFNFR